MPSLPTSRSLIRAAAVLLPLGIAANVGFSLATTDRDLLGALASVPVGSVVLALALVATPWVTQSVRMVIWTRFVGHPLSFGTALRIYAGGVLGSAVTPTAVGGGSIRWALAVRWGVPSGKAASLFSIEAVEDLLFIALALPLAFVWMSADTDGIRSAASDAVFGMDVQALSVLGAVCLGALLIWAALRLAVAGRLGAEAQHRSRRFIARMRGGLRRGWRDMRATLVLAAREGRGWFALTFLLSAVQWIARYSVATVIVFALGGALEPVLYWVLGWLTYAVASPAPTPGAAGATEATFLLLHSPFVPREILPLTSSVWRLLLFYAPATLAALAYPLFVAKDVVDDLDDPPATEADASPESVAELPERIGPEAHREGVPAEPLEVAEGAAENRP